MSKDLAKDEIDLIDVLLIVWKKKFQVLFFVIISLFIVFINQSFDKNKNQILGVEAKTEIRPISFFDEAKYKIFTTIIHSIRHNYFALFPLVSSDEKTDKSLESIDNLDSQFERFKSASLEINKDFLLDLFVDRINEKANLKKLVKKYNFFNESDYPNKIEYQNAINDLSSAINLVKEDEAYFIKAKIPENKDWEKFLKFVELETNIEIQIRLFAMFNDYLDYIESIKTYEIEDIETQLTIIQNDNQKQALRKRMAILNSTKYRQRVKDIFRDSPISKPYEFYAAKIISDLTNYKPYGNKKSLKTQLLVAGICGAIFGIFFVLISNAIRKRN